LFTISPSTRASFEFLGAFESTYMPLHDVDVLETSGHTSRWREDLALLRKLGISRLRYPIRWHRIESNPGEYQWAETDAVLQHLAAEGMAPIVDLVHHTSYPRWLERGFADPRFGSAYLRYCEAFATRYPWIAEYTLFNEPFATLFLAGHEAEWPPHRRGVEGLVELYRAVMPALTAASRMYRDLLPDARHVWVDTCEGHVALDDAALEFMMMANDRRFFAIDLFLGRIADSERPFVREVIAAGGEDLLETEPGSLDVLGLDYYAHSEWAYKERATPAPTGASGHELHPRQPVGHPQKPEVQGITPSPAPVGIAALALQYAARYEHEMALTETNIRGTGSDRATWLKYTLEQCEMARDHGAPIGAYCWFPFIDSLDWNSLLARADRCIDPVGVLALDERLERRGSSMLESYRLAAAGAASRDLPAYRLSAPTAEWVSGLAPQMAHFEWQDPPAGERDRDLTRIVRAVNLETVPA